MSLSKSRIARLLDVAVRAASSAAPAILAGFRTPDLLVERKADGTAVTRVDREAESLIRETLRAGCDDAWPVLGEELGDDSAGTQLRWVIDPIDGTLPYSRGLPHFGTLVAFEDCRAACPLIGVINLPAFAELYTASSGQGARCNGHIIHVAPCRELSQCIISAPAAHVFARAGLSAGYERLCDVGASMLGNADCWMHAMAARGAVDVVVEFGLSRWDIAATEAVVTEAGGRCLLRESRTHAGKCDAVLGSATGVAEVAALLGFVRDCVSTLLLAMTFLWAALVAVPGVAGAAAPKSAATEDGQWTMPAKDYSATRYSGLAQITVHNAGSLHAQWTFSTGVLGGHEGQPLVVNNTMYVVTPWPNTLYAFNLAEKGYPLRWKYRPDVSPNAIGIACCDSVNRGAFFAAGKIIYNLLDGQTVAVDATSGKEVWRTRVAEVRNGETTTMAPFVVNERVLVGASGTEFGIYGWIKALDLGSGGLVWSAHNSGPDANMIVRPGSFKAPYDAGAELGARSWPADAWKTGGASVWGWISYDPGLDLVYYGTGNAAPPNSEQRRGDDKWTSSVLARRPEDGSLVWAYQFTPHDSWDYDATGAMILVDLVIGGKPVKAVVHFNKNGFAYTLDRATGRVLVAAPFAPVTWAKSVDLTTGRPLLEPPDPKSGVQRDRVICPSLEGAVSPSSPAAYSPRLHLFFTSTNNFCMHRAPSQATYLRATPYQSSNSTYVSGPGGHLGSFIAWDAALGRKVWENKEPFPSWSGALVTAGDVVFYGTLDGWFKSVDARTGRLLFQFKVGSGVVGNPITYRGPDGKQYVAVYSGYGGDWALVAGDTRSDDPADVRLPTDFIRNIARYTSQGGSVWIFGL